MSFMEWFDTEAFPKLGIRAPTMRAVLREAQLMAAYRVFETGCVRQDGNWAGDGQSTKIWWEFVTQYGGKNGAFTSCDISKENCKKAEEIVLGLTCLCMDSVQALKRTTTPIDLLYLDSFDLDMSNPHPAALHALMELTAAMPRLHSGSIVFVDDCPMTPEFVIQGKGMYIAEYFKKLDITPFTFGYQAAWKLP